MTCIRFITAPLLLIPNVGKMPNRLIFSEYEQFYHTILPVSPLPDTGIALIQELGNILSCPFYVLSDSRNCEVHLKGQRSVNYRNHCPLFLSQTSAIKFQLSAECLLILNLLRVSPTSHVRANSLKFQIFFNMFEKVTFSTLNILFPGYHVNKF